LNKGVDKDKDKDKEIPFKDWFAHEVGQKTIAGKILEMAKSSHARIYWICKAGRYNKRAYIGNWPDTARSRIS
jgi:hypothetical protein